MNERNAQNIVAIDTSTNWAGVGVRSGDSRAVLERCWHSQQNHCSELSPILAQLLTESQLKPNQLTHIAVALGPGRFSAVRSGIGTAIGLSMPLNLPVIAVPTYQIEAHPYLDKASAQTPLFATLPAGRGEIVWYKYENAQTPTEQGLSAVSSFLKLLGDGFVCGEGVELLREHIDKARILTAALPSRSPTSLIEIAQARLAAGDTGKDPLKPIYARKPSITPPKR